MNMQLLEDYDYVYDMKINHGHTDKTLAKLFDIAISTLQRRTSQHKITRIKPALDLSLLDNYDYVYDLKINQNYTVEAMSELFNVSTSKIKNLTSKHKISTKKLPRSLRLDKLDTTKSILEYSVNTITKSEELSNRLKELTSLLDDYPDVMNSHRYHLLKNNITKIPKCKGCNNKASLNFHTHSKVFYQFCSHLCNSSQTKIDNNIEKILTKEWLYQKRIVENLSYEAIGELAGISFQVIKKRLEQYGINLLNRTWVENKTLEEIKLITDKRKNNIQLKMYGEDVTNKLNNKDYLYEEYVTKRKSALKISKELKIKNTVVRAKLKEFGIDDFNRRYFNSVSDEEIEMYNFIKEHSPSAISGWRKVYKSMELDAFIPELNIGFEYNGCYAHSEARKNKNYHKNKLEYFNNLGIRVVQIWSDDWKYHNNKVKDMILTRLNVIKKTIHARKCVVKEINHQEFSNFLISNHSLSGVNCRLRYGLFNKDKLVSVMGFKSRSIKDKRQGYDLVRFSTLDVHGSFSKLLKHFRNLFPSYDIYSIADLEIVDKNNNVYLSNGFKFEYDIAVDYQYYNYRSGLREDKRKWRKKTFKNLGLDITNKTEHELALEYRLLRCYDSGKIMYKLPA